MLLRDWTVDYGQGPIPCQIPHAWRQDVPVTWEGPAVYACSVSVTGSKWLVFHGVSYEARVIVDGELVLVHEGLWDAFVVPLSGSGQIEIRVEVTKNGGSRFPVRSVASGFLPFVYHTFGGIYKAVELVDSLPSWAADGPHPSSLRSQPSPLEEGEVRQASPSRAFGEPFRYSVEGRKVRLNAAPTAQSASFRSQADEWLARRSGKEEPKGDPVGRELYLRGVLTWGWYPELGHTNPPDDVIRREVDQARGLGFNLIKFCLWVPPHRYLEILEEAGMHAWIELPLWDPVDDDDAQEKIAAEFGRIVAQYRHHANVALWTCGCELHGTTSAAYRKRLYELVKEITGGLVKDNSGSAEMYGGDLREYGDYYDFHPYCDTPFYPEVLDSLLLGSRRKMPILLGEFNDIDVHRDVARLRAEEPYWISENPDLNDKGVRWQHDLPGVIPGNRFANAPDEHRHAALMSGSRGKALFIRKYVQEAVRARDDIAGYVVTGWRDTPISSAGMLDDWDQVRYKAEELAPWNGPSCLFLIPSRRPPWVNGGNRPGWIDPFNWFEGRAFWKIGNHSDREVESQLEWDILHFSWQGNKRPKGRVAQGSGRPIRVAPLESSEVGEISWDTDEPGGYLLRVQFGEAMNTWPFWIVPAAAELPVPTLGLGSQDYGGLVVLEVDGTSAAPFWRESAYEFHNAAFWEAMGYREAWERLLPMTTDRVLDADWVRAHWPDYDWETLMNRIDVRTYAEAPLLMAGRRKKDRLFVTTLRPHGGLGNCPSGLARNPSGANFVRQILSLATG